MVPGLVCRGLLLGIPVKKSHGASGGNAPRFTRRVVAPPDQSLTGSASQQPATAVPIYRLWLPHSERKDNRINAGRVMRPPLSAIRGGRKPCRNSDSTALRAIGDRKSTRLNSSH